MCSFYSLFFVSMYTSVCRLFNFFPGEMAERSKAADCKSVGLPTLVRIQLFSIMFITCYTVKRKCLYLPSRNYSIPIKFYKPSYRSLFAQFSSVHLYTKYFLTFTRRYRSRTFSLRDKRRGRRFRAHRYNIKLFRLSLKSSFRFLVLRFLKRNATKDETNY